MGRGYIQSVSHISPSIEIRSYLVERAMKIMVLQTKPRVTRIRTINILKLNEWMEDCEMNMKISRLLTIIRVSESFTIIPESSRRILTHSGNDYYNLRDDLGIHASTSTLHCIRSPAALIPESNSCNKMLSHVSVKIVLSAMLTYCFTSVRYKFP